MAADPNDCVPNPDLAGIGIVIPILTTSILTLILTAMCTALKFEASNDQACATVSHDPLQQQSYTPGPKRFPSQHVHWHSMFERILLSLSTIQLTAGCALHFKCAATYGTSSTDPHAKLATFLSYLAVYSQVMVPLALRRLDEWTLLFRIRASVLYWLLQFMHTSIDITSLETRRAFQGLATALFVQIAAAFQAKRERLQSEQGSTYPTTRDLRLLVVWLPLVLFTVVMTTSDYMIAVIQHKFGTVTGSCDLNAREENVWTWGQMLLVSMLVALVMHACDAYRSIRDALCY